jgi:hypothetical protein
LGRTARIPDPSSIRATTAGLIGLNAFLSPLNPVGNPTHD